MDTNEKIVSLAVNLYKGNPVGEFSQSDSMETLRKALPGRGVLVGRSAQRSSERGAEPRQADHRVRPHVPRRRSVSVARG